jgi:hypothetical protein
MKEFQPRHNQAQLNPAPGEGTRGVPPPSELGKPQQEGGEHQQQPDVWDYLEREARIHEEYSSGRMTSEEYYREQREMNRFEEAVLETGPVRNDLILKLYTAIILEPSGTLPIPATFRQLSLKELQQFRSRVEPMSEEQIREELRKAEEEFRRKSEAKPTPPFPTEGGVMV